LRSSQSAARRRARKDRGGAGMSATAPPTSSRGSHRKPTPTLAVTVQAIPQSAGIIPRCVHDISSHTASIIALDHSLTESHTRRSQMGPRSCMRGCHRYDGGSPPARCERGRAGDQRGSLRPVGVPKSHHSPRLDTRGDRARITQTRRRGNECGIPSLPMGFPFRFRGKHRGRN
jgi:hypothetical protein